MEKYSDVKEFIDNYKEKIADDFDNIEDYYLILRIGQMYRELEQVKLSYEKLLNTEKGDISDCNTSHIAVRNCKCYSCPGSTGSPCIEGNGKGGYSNSAVE